MWKLRPAWLGDLAGPQRRDAVGLGLTFSSIHAGASVSPPPPTLPQALSKPLSLMLGGPLSLVSCRGDWQAGPLKQREAGTGHPEASQCRQQPYPPRLAHGLAAQVSTCRLLGREWGPAGSKGC